MLKEIIRSLSERFHHIVTRHPSTVTELFSFAAPLCKVTTTRQSLVSFSSMPEELSDSAIAACCKMWFGLTDHSPYLSKVKATFVIFCCHQLKVKGERLNYTQRLAQLMGEIFQSCWFVTCRWMRIAMRESSFGRIHAKFGNGLFMLCSIVPAIEARVNSRHGGVARD
jgi:hypothetical protein